MSKAMVFVGWVVVVVFCWVVVVVLCLLVLVFVVGEMVGGRGGGRRQDV